MPKYAIIKDGLIDNAIIADADFITDHYPDAVELPDGFGVGDAYKDGNFERVIVTIDDIELS